MPLNRRALLLAASVSACACLPALPALAEDREVIDARIRVALRALWEEVPWAADIARDAKAMLIMPDVVKGGFVLGASYGEGGLLLNTGADYGPPADVYYSVAAASVGLQAGLQTSSHALFFMTDAALEAFRASKGWEAGADAEVTFPDKGLNAGVTSRTAQNPIVAVVFGADGLLAGASLEGAKYTPIAR